MSGHTHPVAGHPAPRHAEDAAGNSYTRVQLVVDDDGLSDAEKRDILASWASDRRAVADRPDLRELDDGTVVFIDDILRALKALDGSDAADMPTRSSTFARSVPYRRPFASSRWVMRLRGRRSDDDDDDPPPCPAGSARPFGPNLMGGNAGVLAEVA